MSADAVQRGDYRHYMQKEIFEQPQVVAETLEGRIGVDHVLPNIFGVGADAMLSRVRQVHHRGVRDQLSRGPGGPLPTGTTGRYSLHGRGGERVPLP